MRKYMLAFILFFVGCTTTMPIPEEYRPIVQLSSRPGGNSNMATTIGTTVYVQDPEAWVAERPIGSPRFDGVLHHERVHSHRQLAMGTPIWLARYAASRDFRWQEESLGWYFQLRIYQQRGVSVYPEAIARTLAGYVPNMVDYETALEWVYDVLSGRWKPDADVDIPEDLKRYL